MALLGFFNNSSLLFSPGTSHLMVEDYSCRTQRREHMVGIEEEGRNRKVAKRKYRKKTGI